MLTKESFTGLDRLEWLEMRGLLRLERLDGDTFSNLKRLSRLDASTSRAGKLQLSALLGLRKLTLRVNRISLGDVLSSELGPKLRQLEISGPELKHLGPDSLKGLHASRDLVLQIRDTSIEELPLGLLSRLGRVAHLSLDLRNNKLTSLSLDILYHNLTSWENAGTKLISGNY